MENNEKIQSEDATKQLISQIKAEYQISWENQSSKIEKNLIRLKLYNNQKRDPDAVGDDLLFTVHQTVLASLYQDNLSVEFVGNDPGDEETAENVTKTAEYDYGVMKKEVLDYFWLWDTLFSGRGLIKLIQFNKEKRFNCPIPELIDPFTFLHDSDAVSVNGDILGKGAMRFGGREISFTKMELSEDNGYYDFENLTSSNEIKSLIDRAKQLRSEASGLDTLPKGKEDMILGDNQKFKGLEWCTHFKGKKVMVVLANDMNRIIKFTELGDRFPYIDRPMYPHSHSWDGTSIPDLTEDKQRQRAVAINLGIQSMKSDQYPMYLFDEKRIKNRADLVNFAFNKFIPVQGEGDVRGAAQPLNKATPRLDLVNFIYKTLDASAQRATATPEMQSGQISDEKRTLGELNLVSSKVDTRYSLTAKVFGWSEKAYWETWYSLYKKHLGDKIDEKVIRIKGSFGTTWRKLTKENFTFIADPDIHVTSKNVEENKKLKDRILLNAYSQIVFADPEAQGKRYLKKKMGLLNGLTKEEVEYIYPPTVDELIAKDENEKLSNDEMLSVNPDDDHYVHLQINGEAAETKAKAAHLHAHKLALMVKKQQPELFPQQIAQQTEQPTAFNELNNVVNKSLNTTSPNITPTALSGTQ